jgi:hypothetical protein
MNKYLSVVLAATALTGFGQPLMADQDRHQKKGGAAAVKQAPAPAARAKNVSPGHSAGHRQLSAPDRGSVARKQTQAPQMRTAQQVRTAPQMRSTPPAVAKDNVVRDTNRALRSRTTPPTVALGGSQYRDTRVESSDRTRQSYNRSDVRYYRPPTDVYRNWSHDRVYTWNRHRYHWFGGNWVILGIDPAYAYDYPADYDYPVTYRYADSYSESLVARVQSRLAHDGYDPGPIDGDMGPQTRRAIRAYQDDTGLPITGEIDNSLLRSLGL